MTKRISTEELDKKFDDGDEDIMEYFGKPVKSVSIEFPVLMLKEIDEQAERLGIDRQALIKVWIDVMLTKTKQRRP